MTRSERPAELDRDHPGTPAHDDLAGLAAAGVDATRPGGSPALVIMAAGGIIELAFGVKAEGRSLETVTKPLTAVSTEKVEEGASDE